MGVLESVNIAVAAPNPHKTAGRTGIDKRAQPGLVAVRDPGPKGTGLGSGLVGDVIGDTENHGGTDQAVYAVAREVLDEWEGRLERLLPDGSFGENLTTRGIDVDGALIGERWRVGDAVELVVTSPRIPCVTFRHHIDRPGWLKTFTADVRPGAYLAVAAPGGIRAGDEIRVLHRPGHGVTVAQLFRALTTEKHRLPGLVERLGGDAVAELVQTVAAEAGRAQPAPQGRP
ncbi:MAG: MOSC domain-containing protein [Micrococcales bacterium]|nr:MOSC domain-containing protein [Micrococcales bacterium]